MNRHLSRPDLRGGRWAFDDAIHLAIPAYRTAKGTQVTSRSWRLVHGRDGQWRSERIP
ncbi:hypothetical protein [Parvibaculum sp.]|uniref:hypothetical protein n=1 Tax=Parvibaculum sp. TaxID=2024848 RepID=UPI0025DB6C26|nr:hypothetical protein [Parvibaculum sp.]